MSDSTTADDAEQMRRAVEHAAASDAVRIADFAFQVRARAPSDDEIERLAQAALECGIPTFAAPLILGNVAGRDFVADAFRKAFRARLIELRGGLTQCP